MSWGCGGRVVEICTIYKVKNMNRRIDMERINYNNWIVGPSTEIL